MVASKVFILEKDGNKTPAILIKDESSSFMIFIDINKRIRFDAAYIYQNDKELKI